jgi:cytochrome c oxidase subunit I
MHRMATLLLSPTPILFTCANATVLLQISTPDIAFPWLNAFFYWLFLFDSRMLLSGFLTPGEPAQFGSFAYAPLGPDR